MKTPKEKNVDIKKKCQKKKYRK